MTRFLEKDNGTQVNSNLIGVQVRPLVVPPTYEVGEVEVNLMLKKYYCNNMHNGMPMVHFSDNGDWIWGYSGTDRVVDGVTYNVWECLLYPSDPSQVVPGGVMYTIEGTTIVDNTHFYVYVGDVDPSAPNPMMPGPDSDYKLSYGGWLYRYDQESSGDYYSDYYWYCPDTNYVHIYLNSEPTCDLVDGFFMSKETGNFIGKFTFSTPAEYQQTYGRFYDEDNSYYSWKIETDIENLDLFLYSDVRNPNVGYNLRSSISGPEPYLSPITNVYEEEVDPGYTEDIDCKVEYSVDGETWTAWEVNLTDDNNVIANIPRYMYLKFGQDVEITEE